MLYSKVEFENAEFNIDDILTDVQSSFLNRAVDKDILLKVKKDKKPILALTASAQQDIKEKTSKYGMNGYVSKPFNPTDLYETLKYYKENIGVLSKC